MYLQLHIDLEVCAAYIIIHIHYFACVLKRSSVYQIFIYITPLLSAFFRSRIRWVGVRAFVAEHVYCCYTFGAAVRLVACLTAYNRLTLFLFAHLFHLTILYAHSFTSYKNYRFQRMRLHLKNQLLHLFSFSYIVEHLNGEFRQ